MTAARGKDIARSLFETMLAERLVRIDADDVPTELIKEKRLVVVDRMVAADINEEAGALIAGGLPKNLRDDSVLAVLAESDHHAPRSAVPLVARYFHCCLLSLLVAQQLR